MSRKPSSSQKPQKKPQTRIRTVKLDESSEPPTKKLRPHVPRSTPPPLISSPDPRSLGRRIDAKGKGKQTSSPVHPEDDRLWVDKYEPTTEADLAVHKRKAFEGGPSRKLRKYRRILVLTGPAGTAKTTTLRVLSRELGFEILECANKYVEDLDGYDYALDLALEAIFDKFQTITAGCPQKRQVVLLEDLPNLLHAPTQARFKAVLESLCVTNSSSTPGPPVVIVISDAGLRAEQPDDESWDGGGSGRRWGRSEILDSQKFNPIAPTLMTKALQALLAKHFGSQVSDVIVETANGDIRSALMALQFACVSSLSGKSQTKNPRNRNGGKSAVAVLEASLVLFHLMGKILYNKRAPSRCVNSDPPSSRISAREAAKERELDEKLADPPPLPRWLSHHERKASRVSVECPSLSLCRPVVADSPIDSSLFGLYIHQNYTQFCDDIEQCEGVCDGLSWADWVGGNFNTPYAFPTMALSTLHALPTPVPRLGQKVLQACMVRPPIGRWTHANIAMEMGGWLRAMGQSGSSVGGLALPSSHRLFSTLPWVSTLMTVGDAIGEHEDMEMHGAPEEDGDVRALHLSKDEEDDGKWWAEVDDIEDVD
ncbi:Rad17 cell cycle checkpoint protein-domain-containing protein [Pisolithus microcarpus]|nr:Rad17 cell cycle checkpoint protein-domain-containing protein [Pisolithus microcarpus]